MSKALDRRIREIRFQFDHDTAHALLVHALLRRPSRRTISVLQLWTIGNAAFSAFFVVTAILRWLAN